MQDFKRDIRCFKRFLSQYNGTSFYDHTPTQAVLELDAWLVGLGGRWNENVYHLPIVKHYKNLRITQLEMVNILVAVRILAPCWANKQVLIKCDNQTVVHVLESGRTRDAFMAVYVPSMWMEVVLSDVQFKTDLSRWQNTAYQLQVLQCLVPNPVWVPTSPDLLEINNAI